MANAAAADTAESRTLGTVLVLGSAVFFALAGIFTKSVSSDLWTITSWRGLVGGLVVAAYLFWRRKQRPEEANRRLGWRGWLLALTGGISGILFILAFKLTYVANVAVIFATIPFMAAAIGWLTIRETVRARTLVAAGFSLIGVAIVVSGGLVSGSIAGDMVAILLTALCATYMVMIRAFRETPVVLAAAVSAFGVFAVTLPFADLAGVTTADAVLMTLFGVSFALSIVLWTEGTRLIPAPEAGLIGCAEIPLAIFFAWLILAELPPAISAAGGALVIAAVFLHAGVDLAQDRAKRRRSPV